MLQFSPTKSVILPGVPSRFIQPSPEKKSLTSTTVLVPGKKHISTSEAGSPMKRVRQAGRNDDSLKLGKSATYLRGSETGKPLRANKSLDAEFDAPLGNLSESLQRAVASSKRVELTFSLIGDGQWTTPPSWDSFQELKSLFPTTFEVEVIPPILLIRVRVLPPKPWPMTVAGMPLRLTTDPDEECFKRGMVGRGGKELIDIDLRQDQFTAQILESAIRVFTDKLKIAVKWVFWLGAIWIITVPAGTDIKVVPRTIGHHVCHYQWALQTVDTGEAALEAITPEGVIFDISRYDDMPDALLRPGIMVSSSVSNVHAEDGTTTASYKSATSGILVADKNGEPFVTVASHCFNQDGDVYHPKPNTGTIIGKVLNTLGDTDLSIVRLKKGLRYTNETFGAPNRRASKITGINPGMSPHLRIGDELTMENPFSGFCEATYMGPGGSVEGIGKDTKIVKHVWLEIENGGEPINGSCGSAILDDEGRVVSFFRFLKSDGQTGIGVAADHLREYGYEICSGVHTF